MGLKGTIKTEKMHQNVFMTGMFETRNVITCKQRKVKNTEFHNFSKSKFSVEDVQCTS